MAKIGVQAMMLKDKFSELGAYETLKKVTELGYNYIEISQIPMTEENVSEIKRAAEDFNIKIAAMTAALEAFPGMNMENLTDDFDKIVKDCKTLNCNYLRIGILPFHCMGNMTKIIDFTKKMNEVAERLLKEGIHLYYHNHHIEFEKYDGKLILDIMKDHADKIGFEIDVHWVYRGGIDPVKLLEDYSGKVALVHLKDYRIGPFDIKALEFLKEGKHKEFTQSFVGSIQFAEVGEGTLDFKSIIPAAIDSGAEYLLVEQDDTYGVDPFKALETSAKNLKEMGFGELF